MKGLSILALFVSLGLCGFAHGQNDTSKLQIPLERQLFHDRVTEEQKQADMLDGKRDTALHLSEIASVNEDASKAIFQKVDWLKWRIEADTRIPTQNQKVKYLQALRTLVQDFQIYWRNRQFQLEHTTVLVKGFQDVMDMDMKGTSMEPLIRSLPYDVGRILDTVFYDNPGVTEAKKVVFLKYCTAHPDAIMNNIAPYAGEAFADSLVSLAALKRPQDVYTQAQATGTVTANLIRRNPDPKVQLLAKLSDSKNGQLYFPFMDDLLSGKQTIEGIDKALTNNLLYYRLLVNTEVDYAGRQSHGELPVGMRDLTNMLQKKAVEWYITPINELHESPDPVRFKVLEPLSAQELYYLIVLGEEDIYTSSYVYVYKKMMEKVPSHKGDSLLLSINLDKFKKFIKLAANYNTLSDFLKSMQDRNSALLMSAFVRGLDRNSGNGLEDAVDVADSYASINDPALKEFLLSQVQHNYNQCVSQKNKKGEVIYNLLQTIFAASDSNSHVDLTKQLGIPPIYTLHYKDLTDDSGMVVEQVFFYGDKDGKQSYNDFMGLFGSGEWRVTRNAEWVTIKSIHGRPIWIYANLPLDNETDKDDKAQSDLCDYLDDHNLHPSVVIHRGHSYHVKYTIERLPTSAKIVILGSCGGYKNLHDVLTTCPDAQIVSSKQTGTQTVNEPIIKAINGELLEGRDIEWIPLWSRIGKEFKGNAQAQDRFSDYIPPHKNLGALFIKAYKIQMGGDDDELSAR